MNDGGPTNTGPFSFDAGFASCADELDAGTLDTISVQGQLGALGNVHYTLSGYAAGMTTSSGVQRYVNVDYARVGPSREIGLEVWVSGFQSGVIALTGVTYEGTNFVQPSVPPFHQFINFHANLLTPDHVTCPDQQGHGRFVFAHIPNTPFQDPTPTEPYQGIYEFDCPDAGIHVSGCFSYEF